MNDYKKEFLGIPLFFSFRFADTRRYFSCVETDRLSILPDSFISVSDSEFLDWERGGNSVDAFGEFCLLCRYISTAMMNHDCFVFHAAAVRFRDLAWLITAPSGTGKTTQCIELLTNHSSEISLINGDKPFIDLRGKSAMVHPSPWNGKEGLKGAKAAPLAGIFLLRRGEDNSISPCSPVDAAVYGFTSVFQTYENTDSIKKAAELTDRMLKSVPVWLFTSCDIKQSSELLYEKMKEEADRIAL